MSYTPPIGDATTTAKGVIQLAGDLSGTATAPSVKKVNGITLPTAAPTAGQVLTASSATVTAWTTPSGGSYTDPLTTKGDIVVRGATTTRLGVGTNGQVLVADSTQATGLSWAAVNDTTSVKLAGSTMTGKLVVPSFQVTTSAGAGKVLVSDASGNATWQTAPLGRMNVTSQSTNYTAAHGDMVVVTTTSAITITLPAPTNGASVSVKKVSAGTNSVTITAGGSVAIDGQSTFAISQQYVSQDFLSDGTEWYLV